MVFNSIFFIFCFLPVFMLIYYLVPGKLRNLLLFLGSLIFYAWGEPVYVILMLFSSIFNYYMGTELERLYYDDRKQKINLIFSIIINLAVLVFFKYYGFLLNTIGGIIGIHIPHPELSRYQVVDQHENRKKAEYKKYTVEYHIKSSPIWIL